jgi:hypothetical protein
LIKLQKGQLGQVGLLRYCLPLGPLLDQASKGQN